MIIRKEKEVDIVEGNIEEYNDVKRNFTVCIGDNVTYYKVDKASEKGLRRIAKIEYRDIKRAEVWVIQIVNKSFNVRELILFIKQGDKKCYMPISVVRPAIKLSMTEIVEVLYKEIDKGKIEWGAIIMERLLISYLPFVLCVICTTVLSIYLLYSTSDNVGTYIALIVNLLVVLGYIIQMIKAEVNSRKDKNNGSKSEKRE